MLVSENLNTLYVDFIKQCASSRSVPAKIVLAEMPITEYINSLVLDTSLPKLQETIRLCNFITLLEKCAFAHNTIFHMGCPKCEKTHFYSEANSKFGKSPNAYLEVLAGDE